MCGLIAPNLTDLTDFSVLNVILLGPKLGQTSVFL